MNKSTGSIRGFSTYILAAALFAGTSVVSHNETFAIGFLTNQDPQIAAGAYGAYGVFISTQKMKEAEAQIRSELGRIQAESNKLGEQAQRLMLDADGVEKGRPLNLNESIYSQGRYGDAQTYMQNGGASPKLADPKFRLQTDDAKSIIGSLKDRTDLRKATGFSMELTVVDGTQDGRIKTLTQNISGSTLNEVTEALIDKVDAQSKSSPRGSIVSVRFNWTEVAQPNPTEAAKIRARAEKITVEQKAMKESEAGRVKEVEAKFESTLKGLKRIRLRGGAWIVGAVLFGGLRDGISAEMTTLAQACESEDIMRTQIVTRSIQTGLSQDEVAFELQNACSE